MPSVSRSARALGAQARNLEHLDETLRCLRGQLLQERQRAGFEDRADLASEVAADARQLVQPSRRRKGRRRNRKRPHCARCSSVGTHAELILALDLEQVRDLLEDARDVNLLNRAPREYCGNRHAQLRALATAFISQGVM